MDKPFDSHRLLIKEAENSIASLEMGIKAFLGNKQNTLRFENEAHTGHLLMYVQYAEDIPAKVSLDVRTAVRELRDALDHAVYASAVTLQGGDPKQTKFLVADTPEGIADDIKRRRCNDVHEDIITIMVDERAYETGNKTLWALNKFRNSNTHKVVSLAHLNSGGLGFNNGFFTVGLIDMMSDWKASRRRLYVARITRQSEIKGYVNPKVEIVLQQAFGFPDQGAAVVLRNAMSQVVHIVNAIENATTRIAGRL